TDFLSERNGFQQFMDSGSRLFGTEIGKLKESDDMIQALDQSLTGIAQQRGPEAASRAFDKLTTQAGMSREEIGQLKNLLPGLTDAIGSRSVGDLLNIFDDLPGILNRGTKAANTFKGALQSATAALEGRASARDFEASGDDATAALRQNGRTLDINTAKGRANSAALDNIAGSALKVADGMRGANRVEFLKGARGDFIAMARDMGKTAAQARNLADRLGLIARQDIKPKIDLNKAPFDAVSRAIMAGLRNLDRQNPRPTADINAGPFTGKRAMIMAALGVTDRFTANPAVNLTDNASGKARSIQASINAIQGKTVEIVVNTFRNVFGNKNEDGGLYDGPVRAFADGGYGSNGRYYSARSPSRTRGGATSSCSSRTATPTTPASTSG
ncbi:hypothetical protein, partial [Streptomyces rhizosphaericus]|uniref:hypothetical protein n=1 Tax=Streptomyces rhizosphaericus TaxID=114699 RepID=UPI0031D6C93D